MSENQPDNLQPVSSNDGGGTGYSALERQWGMFCHLAGLAGALIPTLGNIIGPLIIWLMKKDEYPFVNSEGKESLNFQLSVTLYYLVSVATWWTCISFVLTGAVYVFAIVEIILASIKANEGVPYKYPLTIRFIK